MTDPRRTPVEPSPEQAQAIMAIANAHLCDATARVSHQIGIAPISTVFAFFQIIANDLRELDPVAASQYIRCVSVWADPDSTDDEQEAARTGRRKAAEALSQSADLATSAPEGTA